MKQYSFLNTVLLINGVEIGGFDEGDDIITMARFNVSSSHKIGADGEMSVAIGGERAGYFDFRLAQTSNSNLYLSGLTTAQEEGVFVPVFVQFRDTAGNDLVSGTQGYIPKPADMIRGTGINSQQWLINCERLVLLHNGA